MISDRMDKIAGHASSMTTYYSHSEITDFSQYPEYLIDQVASFLKTRGKKLPSSHCIGNRNEAI